MQNEITEGKPKVTLSGIDGNAFSIMGAVKRAMQQHYGRPEYTKYFSDYQSEAMSGDYDHLIQTTMRYCEAS